MYDTHVIQNTIHKCISFFSMSAFTSGYGWKMDVSVSAEVYADKDVYMGKVDLKTSIHE